jgi:hypothetical protein
VKIRTSRTLAKRWAKRVSAAGEAYRKVVAAPKRGEPHERPYGAQRYAERVPKSKSKWARGWEPYRKILLGLKLPPRGPVRSPQNFERVRIICEALHKEKLRRERMDGKKRRPAKMPAMRG